MKFGIFLYVLTFFFHCFSSDSRHISAESEYRSTLRKGGFRDIVRLRKGTVLSGVKAVETRGTVVVTDEEGESTVYNSKEILKIERNVYDPDADSSYSNVWSPYQGEMSWQEAKETCESQEMRLPTRAELLSAHRVGAWEHWKKDRMFSWYWSSEEYSAERAYSVGIHGESVYSPKSDRYHYVRCIRKQEQSP